MWQIKATSIPMVIRRFVSSFMRASRRWKCLFGKVKSVSVADDVAPANSHVKDDNINNAEDELEELCSFIMQRLEPAIVAIQQRRKQLEVVHAQWHSVPDEARVLAPVGAIRAQMLDMMEEQNKLEEKFADYIKGMVEHHHGGAAVLAAVWLRCGLPSAKKSDVIATD